MDFEYDTEQRKIGWEAPNGNYISVMFDTSLCANCSRFYTDCPKLSHPFSGGETIFKSALLTGMCAWFSIKKE